MRTLLEARDFVVHEVRLFPSTRSRRPKDRFKTYQFEVEGTARQYALRDGEFVDALMMARRSRATIAR